ALSNKRHNELFGKSTELDKIIGTIGQIDTIKLNGRWLIRSCQPTNQGGTVVRHTDVTDLKERERELEVARLEAVEADAAKSRFVSTMSYELLTPLDVIMGSSRLMASDSNIELQARQVSEYADIINENGRYLRSLIDDIIDYSKVGLTPLVVEKNEALETEEVDLRTLITDSIKTAARIEKVTNLSRVHASISRKVSALRVNERTVSRILVGLMGNALKFTSDDKKIQIKVDLDRNNRPFISIRDFGKGIPESELEKVFEPFYQNDRRKGGTGIGLTLSRHLARLHNGDVLINSREGAGTTAILLLPATTYIQPAQTADEDPIRRIA
ncbi:MAG: HAMP domain-containing sensor histidine kinase, partial [Pseudomonadota bacterium]